MVEALKHFEYRAACAAMGTRFELFLRGADVEHLETVAVAVCEEIARLDGVLSRFKAGSEIARVNREASAKPVRVDREVFALLERCEQARCSTDDYFDATAASGGQGIELSAERCAVQFTRPDVVLDLGALGKGYALDCGREILLRFGVESALLHSGTSSVLALGAEEWPINIGAAAQMRLLNRGFSCSAVRHAEQTQSDVVNPLLQQPLKGNAACVVLAASATEAEIFSTALLAMGRERAAWYLAGNPDYDLQVGWREPDAGLEWLKQ